MPFLPPPNHRGPRLLLAGLLSVGVHAAALGIAGALPVAAKLPPAAVELTLEAPWSPGLEDQSPGDPNPNIPLPEPPEPVSVQETVVTVETDDSPPPSETLDLVELTPIPPRNAPVRPNAARPSLNPPPTARSNGNPGVVSSGLPPGNGGTGTSGANSTGGGGHWVTPKPVYPNALKMARQTGSGSVRIQTDASGRVIRAEMIQSITPALDAVTTNFARTRWSGPPNRTVVVPVTYELR